MINIIILDVTRDPKDPDVLLVEDAELGSSEIPSLIIFRLVGFTARIFNIIWQDRPPPVGIFSAPPLWVEPGLGNWACMGDAHTQPDPSKHGYTKGEWSYQLEAWLDGEVKSRRFGTNNANIKNK